MHTLTADRAPFVAALSLLLACALAVFPAPVVAQAAAAGATAKPEAPEASIAFADHGGINNWEADGDRGLWVQSSHRKWYYGTFAGPCIGLQFHETLKFRFSPSGSLDRFSQVETRDSGGSCWFKSFKASEGPPRSDKAQAGKDKAKGDGKGEGKGANAAPAAGKP